jgi:hypothetical protein
MNLRNRGIALLVVQCLLVSSISGKYLYERLTRPRVWVRVAQYDPNLPMRGRYMALTPLVNACDLPRDKGQNDEQYWSPPSNQSRYWRVITRAKDGKLVIEVADNTVPRSETLSIYLTSDKPCDRVALTPGVDFFIPDTADPPFPKKRGEELWAEVTVPAVGPPRPIQLAMSDNGQWKVLKLN